MTSELLREQFQALTDQHRRILYKVCNSYCHNRDDREDLAQEIVIQLWQAFPGFDEQFRFSTWMYRIALNVAISFYRRESARSRHVLSDEERVLNAIDESATDSEEIRTLYQFIAELNPLHRALVLLYVDGHSYQEIAVTLGITETNVATKLARLKQEMKQKFEGTPKRPERS